jgi:hypothetical protein
MNRRLLPLLVMFALLTAYFFGPTNYTTVHAAPSAGCSAVNAGALNGNFTTSVISPTLAWTQGEVITATFVNYVSVTNLVTLNLAGVGGTQIFSGPLLAGDSVTLSATVPTSTIGHIQVFAFFSIVASITTTCTPVAGPPPPGTPSGPPAAPHFDGPGIPAGFVLKTVTCDMAVFDSPGGVPVGENRFTTGATWFMNPTPKKDAKGRLWTEVFVGGWQNGWILTSCTQ